MRNFYIRSLVCAVLGTGAVFTTGTPAQAVGVLDCGNVHIWSQAGQRYVSAELGYTGGNYGMLRARATTIGPWEQFQLCHLSDGNVAFWSFAAGKWVSAELGYTGGNYGMLRARGTSIGPWEEFQEDVTDGGDRFLAYNNRWVSAELGYTGGNYGMLRARATTAGAWEQFFIKPA